MDPVPLGASLPKLETRRGLVSLQTREGRLGLEPFLTRETRRGLSPLMEQERTAGLGRLRELERWRPSRIWRRGLVLVLPVAGGKVCTWPPLELEGVAGSVLSRSGSGGISLAFYDIERKRGLRPLLEPQMRCGL